MADVENLINSLENVFDDSPSINGTHIRLVEQERRLSNVSFESDPGGIHCAKKPSRNIFYSETDLQKDHNLSLTLKNDIDNKNQCTTTKPNVHPLRPIAPPRPKSKSSSTDQNNIVIINSDLNSPHILFHNTYSAVDSSHQFFHGSASTSIPEFATIPSTLLTTQGITSEAHHTSNAPITTPKIELAGDGFSSASLNCVTMAAKTMSTSNISTVITMNSSSTNMTNNQSSIMSFSAGTGDRTTTGTATKYKKTFWDMLAPSYKTRNEDFKKLFFPNISHTVTESNVNVTVEGDTFNCSFETEGMPTNLHNTSSSILTSPSPTSCFSVKGDAIVESTSGSIITDPNNLMSTVVSSGNDNISTNGLNDLAERLIVDYSCALQKEILIQGRMYISQSYLCFYANIFRWESKIKIRFKDIVAINKEKLAKIIPNALTVLTNTGAKFTFASFTARDKTYFMLFRIWQKALMDQPIAPNEIWRYVHESYGNELGLTSEDEDYVDPRNNATIVSPHNGSSHYHYHHHPYKKHGGVKSGNSATKILVSPMGKLQSSPGRPHKLSRKEARAQSPTSNLVDETLGPFTTNHDNSFVGSSAPQKDLFANDHEDDLYFDTDTNLSVCQEAINSGEEAFSDTDLPRFSPLASKQISGKMMATLRGGRERKTESDDIGGGNMHYGMDDETLTITTANSNTDDIFKNITKTAIFKNNPPLEEQRTSSGKFTSDDELCYNGDSDNLEGDCVSCLCTNHPGKLYLDVLIHDKSCDDVFTMLFTNSSFFRNLQKERHTKNLVMSEWQRSTESLGQNNNSLGNKGGLHHPHKISGGINKAKLMITSSASYLAKRKKRVLSYVVQISSPIGNKSAPTTEKQTLLIGNEAKRRSTRRHHYRISRRYVVECEVTNSGVPYSDAYYVICRYCITAMVQNNDNIEEGKNTTTQSNNKNITNESKKLAKSNVRPLGCRLRVHCLIGYKKSVFSLVKSIIEKNCQSGLQDYFNFLGEKIVHEMRARSISHCVLEQQNMSETKNLPYTQSNNLDRNTPLNYKRSHGELRKSVKTKQSLVNDDLNIKRNGDENIISEHHQKSLSLDYRRRASNVNFNDHHGDSYEIPNNTNKLRKGANDKIWLYTKIETFVSTSVDRLRTKNIRAIVGAFNLKIFFLLVICCYILSLHKRVAYLENIIGVLNESKIINQTLLRKESTYFPKQPIIHQTTLFSKPQNVNNIYSYTTFLTDILYWAANSIYQIIEIPFKIYDSLRTQYCSGFLSYGDHLRMMELHERLLDKIERMYEKMQSSNSNK